MTDAGFVRSAIALLPGGDVVVPDKPGRIQPRCQDGTFAKIHGAYARHGSGSPEMRQTRYLRGRYALALGYPSWTSTPSPVKAAIKQAVRLELFAEHLFSVFWNGQEPPKRYDTVSENLRRVLHDIGLEPRAAGKTLEEYLRKHYGEQRATNHR